MKRYLSALILLLGGYLSATTVTGTIQDINGNRYSNGTVSAFSVITGASMTPGATDANGSFSITLSPSTYLFTVCARPVNIGPSTSTSVTQVCSQPATPIVISGGSQDVSAQINAVAPILGPSVAALLAANNAFIGNNTHAGTETFNGLSVFNGLANLLGGGTMQGTWTSGPTLTISSISESGNTVTVVTTTPCSALAASFYSIVVSGVPVSGYNTGPNGLIGFFTASACVGSTFTYQNSTTGLGASSGGTITVSPVFTQGLTHIGPETISGQLTVLNENQFFHVPPGSLITIDGAISNCPAGTGCPVIISPQANVSDSAGVITTSLGYKFYCGPIASTAIISDWRKNLGSAASPAGVTMYPLVMFGRDAGQVTMTGTNFCVTGNPGDSAVASTNFMVFHNGIEPINDGAIMGAAGLVIVSGSLTVGGHLSPFVGLDAENFFGPTSIDSSVTELDGVSSQVHFVGGASEVGNSLYAVAYSAKTVDIVALVTGRPSVTYGLDVLLGTAGQTNMSLHLYGTFASEINAGWTVWGSPFTITTATVAGTDATFTVVGICPYTTTMSVFIQGVGGNTPSTANAKWTGTFPVTTACSGGSTFHATVPAGLSNSSGGTAKQVIPLINPRSSDSAVIFNPISDAVGWKFITNAGVTALQVLSGGIAVAGTAGPSTPGGAYLGGTQTGVGTFPGPWAGLFLNTGSTGNGAAGMIEFGYDSTTGTEQHTSNNNAVSSFTGAWNCTNVTPVTVNTSTTADQNVMACTVPAGTLNRVGRSLRVTTSGIYSTPAASTAQMTIKVKLCTVSGCGSGTVITLINIQSTALGTVQITNDNWGLNAISTTQTAGATSSHEAHGDFLIDLATLTTAADSPFGDLNTATVGTIDSSAQLFLQVTFAFSAASASNTSTERQLVVETIN